MSLNAAQKGFVRHLVSVALDKKDASNHVMSDAQYAALIEVHVNTVGNWKKNPEVQAAVKKALAEIEDSNDHFLLAMKRRSQEEMWKQYLDSKGSEKRHYLEMIRSETKDVLDYDDTPEYEDLSDEDLVALCLKREVSPVGMTMTELRRLSKKGDDGE